jgi:hypothetical protein
MLFEGIALAGGVGGTYRPRCLSDRPIHQTYTDLEMTRRTTVASFLFAVVLIALLFALGAVLDWPGEAFAWAILGGGFSGMLIAYLLFYEEPPDPEGVQRQILESLDRLTDRVEALERKLERTAQVRR